MLVILLISVAIGYQIGRLRHEGKPIEEPPPHCSFFKVIYINGDEFIAEFSDGKKIYYRAVNYDPPKVTGFYRLHLKEERFDFCSYPDDIQYSPELVQLDPNLFKPQSRTA